MSAYWIDVVEPQVESGDQNIECGVWRNRCCGDEIVLYRGATVPVCSLHNDKPAEWVLISTIDLGPR